MKLAVRATQDSRLVTEGSLVSSPAGSHAVVPLRKVERTVPRAKVCVQNFGSAGLRIAGQQTSSSPDAPTPPRVRLEWLRSGEESWLDIAVVLASRVALGKANPIGITLLPALGVLMLAGIGLAFYLLLKAMSDDPS